MAITTDGRWLLVVTTAKAGEAGQVAKLPRYVTESGYEEFEDVRTRVGHNAPLPQRLSRRRRNGPGHTLREAAGLMAQRNVGAAVVVDGANGVHAAVDAVEPELGEGRPHQVAAVRE